MSANVPPEVVFRAEAAGGLVSQFVQSPWFAMGAIAVVAVVAVGIIQFSTRVAIRTIRSKVREALAEVDAEPSGPRSVEIRTTGLGRMEIATAEEYLSFSRRGGSAVDVAAAFVDSLREKVGETAFVVSNEADESRKTLEVVVTGQERTEIVAAARETGMGLGLVCDRRPMTVAVAQRVAERHAVRDAARSLPVLRMVSGLSAGNAEVVRIDVETVPAAVESIVMKKVTLTWSVEVRPS